MTTPEPAEILAALAVPVVLLDPDGRIVFVNAAAEALFNVSQSALRERGWDAALPPGGALRTLIAEARRQDGNYAAYDLDIALAGGARVRTDVLAAMASDGNGSLILSFQTRSVASMVDRQIVHQGAARSAVGVAAMLAHEIKNPLSGIKGAAQLLAQTADAEGGELTSLICNEVDRIAALVDRMEGFTDTRSLSLGPQNIHVILSHVRRIAEPGLSLGLDVRERYDPSLPPVAGNRDALVQVFLNLVKNAGEALAGCGGEILLTTAYRHGLRVVTHDGARVSVPIEICVIDTGPGAPPELADHLFDPFVTTKPSGGGLGLALVAKIVGDHGGIVEYDRQDDPPRTILRVLLPMHAERS